MTGDAPGPGQPVVGSGGPAHAAERELRQYRARAGRSLTAAKTRLRRWSAIARLPQAAILVMFGWAGAVVVGVLPATGSAVAVLFCGVVGTTLVGGLAAWRGTLAQRDVEDSRRVLERVERDYDEAFQRMLDGEVSDRGRAAGEWLADQMDPVAFDPDDRAAESPFVRMDTGDFPTQMAGRRA